MVAGYYSKDTKSSKLRLLVISDTHGSVKAWEDLSNLVDFKEFTSIFHLGDVLYHGPRNPLPDGYDPRTLSEKLKVQNIQYIRGNCDADVDLKVLGLEEMAKVSMEYISNFTFILVHGEIFEENDIIAFLRGKEVNILIYGHTHIPRMEIIEGKLVLNPGSISLPKNGTPRSFLILEIEGNLLTAKFMNVD
ncbi:MAG: phosphodiesterase, partial [Fervidobacterium pennivorans]